MEEAVELYLNHLEDAETRHQVFLEKGIELRRQELDPAGLIERIIRLDTMLKTTKHRIPSLSA